MAPIIQNPEYRDDVYAYDSFAWVGFELWNVHNGRCAADRL
jgi:hypothetical protein